MEIDAVKWITDVENAAQKNARRLAQLYERVEQIKGDIEEHRVDSKERADERLDQIMSRFDSSETLSSKRVGVALSFCIACCSAIWFTILEPMADRIAVLERRLYGADRSIPLDPDDS